MTLDQYLVPSITYMDEDGQVLTQLQSLYLLCPHNYANNELGGGLTWLCPYLEPMNMVKRVGGVIFHFIFLDITSIMSRLIIFLKLLLDNK